MVPRPFGVIPLCCSFLVTLPVDHPAVDIDGNGIELTLSEELSENFEIDFSEHVGCFVADVPKNFDTVSGSLIEMANSLIRGLLYSSLSLSSLSIPMKLL